MGELTFVFPSDRPGTIPAMDRELLERYLNQGLSLTQIGVLANRHPSTVGYWIQKHGLTANGRAKYAPRGGLTRKELEPLIEHGATLQEIADHLGRRVSTVRRWIDRLGLASPQAVRRRKRALAIANRERVVTSHCDRHGATVFVVDKRGRLRCRKCRMEAVAEWRRRTKAKLVLEAGGKCQLCGYDRCLAALEFHHIEPGTKSFGLSVRGVTRSIEKLRAEAAKCALLCSNCHAEVEVGRRDLSRHVAAPPAGFEPASLD